MAARVVGLDIGSFAVRAAEVQVGAEPTLIRFGQVTLPPGAVRDGEVVDPPAVSAAIRRLWREAGFKAKAVVVGMASVIVRVADLPAMADEDMAAALRFEAQELIPIPVDDAVLDFQHLEDLAPTEGGEPMTRILLAAAQRDSVRSQIAAVEGAGLRVAGVDPVPFALIRSLATNTDPLAYDGPVPAEAIVSVGGGVTTVVVHEGGIPRFVRVLTVGGDDITEGIARELDLDLDTAEDLKRRADTAADDPVVAQAGRLVAARLIPMVEEIRGSLEYYLAQATSVPISRVLVTGGASRTTGLMQRLQQQLGERVETAHPLDRVRADALGLTPDALDNISPLVAVPLGLALGGVPAGRGAPRRISLVPAEVAVAREQRRVMILTGGGVAALAALLLVLWFLKGSQLEDARDKADEAEAEQARLQREVNALQSLAQQQAEVNQRLQEIRNAMAGEIAYTRVIQEIATVLPSDTWLTNLTFSKTEVSVGVQGFDHTSTARFILRMNELSALTGLWVPSSTKSGPGGNSTVTFGADADFTPAAQSDRFQRRFGSVQ